MSEPRRNIRLRLLALVPIVCCTGLPRVAAAGISIALAAWIGGVAVGTWVLTGAAAVFFLRVQRRHRSHSPSLRVTSNRS